MMDPIYGDMNSQITAEVKRSYARNDHDNAYRELHQYSVWVAERTGKNLPRKKHFKKN